MRRLAFGSVPVSFTMACAMLTRLAAARMSHGTPSVLPTIDGASSTSCARCSGVIAAIWRAIRSPVMVGQPATTAAVSPAAAGAAKGSSMLRAASASASPNRSNASPIARASTAARAP